MNKKHLLILLSLLFFVIMIIDNFVHKTSILRVGTTSSFENSGLSDYLFEHFDSKGRVELQHLVYGSGQIIELTKRGDLDVIITHAPNLEKQLIEQKKILYHIEFMYNDFILLGPKEDIASVKHASSIFDALARIKQKKARFISRGDNSGTHIKEIYLWQKTGFKTQQFSPLWYIEAGLPMGAAINLAREKNAYILSDYATWQAHKKNGNIVKLYEGNDTLGGDDILRNIYSISIVKNSDKYEEALYFKNWLTGEKIASLINNFCINNQSVFKSLLYKNSKEQCRNNYQ